MFKFTRSVGQLRVHEKCVTQQSGQRTDRAEKHWCGDSARMSFSVFCPATGPSLLKSLKPLILRSYTHTHTQLHMRPLPSLPRQIRGRDSHMTLQSPPQHSSGCNNTGRAEVEIWCAVSSQSCESCPVRVEWDCREEGLKDPEGE